MTPVSAQGRPSAISTAASNTSARSMGKFEKLVVLVVLFLAAVVLAISLTGNDESGEASGPYDAAQARLRAERLAALEPEPSSTSSKASAEEEAPQAERPDYLLDAEVRLRPQPHAGEGAAPVADAGSQAEPGLRGPIRGDGGREGGAPRILRERSGLAPSALDDFMLYTARADDTWSGLGQRFYGDAGRAELLRRANEDRSELREGMTILVPVFDLESEAGTREPLRPARPAPDGAPETRAEGAETSAAAAQPGAAYAGGTYEVRPGDSLSVISQRVYGSAARWREIYEANRDVLKSPDRVQAGTKLRIPRPGEVVPSPLDVATGSAATQAADDGPRVR